MKHFKNIKSLEDLKNQFKTLARKNHPDVGGGNIEIMKAINSEYDQLFPIWKSRYNATSPTPTTETAQGTRSEFYTQYGSKGHKYDSSLSLKQIAINIRTYVKELYPTYKFSIRTEYASMCQELHVALMEAPQPVYKSIHEWTEEEKEKWSRELPRLEHYHNSNKQIEKIKNTFFFNDATGAVIDDVNREVKSYNYDDSDAMIDYFSNNFYYFGCKIGKWDKEFKVVEKIARVKERKTYTASNDNILIPTIEEEYEVKEDIHTKTREKLFIVKILRTLSKDEYLEVSKKFNDLGGYYSRFKHGFIFKVDPTEILNRESNNATREKTKQDKQEAQSRQQDGTKVIERINKAIDSTQNKIDKLSGDYNTNTYKRMREQEGREAKIQGYKLDLNILSYLLETVQKRNLTPLETALLTESFRNTIDSYYRRFETWNLPENKRPSSSVPVKYPEKDLNYPDSWWNEEVPKIQKRLQKANISNTHELIKNIEEYKVIIEVADKPQDETVLKIKRLERECKMMQKGDINFTPREVAKRLVELARISEGEKVLEPSAGIAHIADEIRKITSDIDVVERMATFRELLLLKGYSLVGDDFLQYKSEPIYDAIIMNPPFSDEQNHIKHAFELLKSGGTLVSISSPHWTFANDRKSVEFRQWLENETYFIEDLESGTFEMTGVASKIVVIEKHEQECTKVG